MSFSQLVDELQTLEDATFKETVKEELLGKLRRKRLSDRQADRLEAITGSNQSSLCAQLREKTAEEIVDWFRDHSEVVELLDELGGAGKNYLVSDELDCVIEVGRGYGKAQKPEDYLDAFRKFIADNQEEIAALKLVTTRPSDLTPKDLRQLRLTLDEQGFTPESLRVAVRETTNRDMAVSIIGYIRHVALGVPLAAHADRVKAAIEQILVNRAWTVPLSTER